MHGMTIHLGRLLSNASCDQPGRQPGNRSGACAPCHPYSVLLPVGFAVPLLLPGARCALTAPFHPCPRRARGGLLSVALSLGLPPPGVTRHRASMEPGLSSPPANTRRYSSEAAIRSTGAIMIGTRGVLRSRGGRTIEIGILAATNIKPGRGACGPV